MPPLIFAHLGHWYISLPIFMGPALLVVIALKVQTWRERDAAPGDPRSSRRVLVSGGEDESTTISLHGRLDYPALLEFEVELGGVVPSLCEVRLDLSGVSEVDRETAWLLCDSIGKLCGDRPVVVVLPSEHSLDVLRGALAAEDIRVLKTERPDPISSGREP
ncbi:MAG TPA: hypothetical protein VGY30_03545 [Solirubrobacteraceae bacterium]|jgi:ABC-type transporter Mla MlaB component|nr:hypothetical protein [Solirubrobacteraceae bacterium]